MLNSFNIVDMGIGNMQIVPGESRYNVEPQLVELMVPLYSHGCANKIHKALSHLKGIYSVHVDYNEQKVRVWGICNKHQVLSTVRSKRKAARFWNNNDQEETTTPTTVTTTTTTTTTTRPPSFALNKLRSLSFKLACKKVFNTAISYSFPIPTKLPFRRQLP